MSADVRPDEIEESISDVISLARYMNVCAKASALSTITPSKFPLDRLKIRMKELLGEYGCERVFRSEEHTSELQSLMRISYAVFCLKKKNKTQTPPHQ